MDNFNQSRLNNAAALSGARIARTSTVAFFVVSQLKRQIEALAASGAQITVVTSYGPEMDSLQKIPGVCCMTIEIPRSISPLRDLVALIKLYYFFRQKHIDIAHSTTPKAGLLTAIAAFMAQVPVRLHTFTGQPWVNMRGIKRMLARWSETLIGKLNTRCYADSSSQRQFLIDQGIINEEQIYVIGSGSLAGVDTARFNLERFPINNRVNARHTLGIPDDASVLLFVGRITVDKGIIELLEAFRKLTAALNNVHLVFVGRFDSESGVAGEIFPGDISSIPGTHLVGYTEHPEEYIAIADILCLPSYREGFGTVVIEAAAMGVPTVGTDIYGLSDAIVNGETGILVPPRNAAALESALRDLLNDETKRSKLGSAAKLRAEKLFSADEINKKVVEEYCRLLSANKGINVK